MHACLLRFTSIAGHCIFTKSCGARSRSTNFGQLASLVPSVPKQVPTGHVVLLQGNKQVTRAAIEWYGPDRAGVSAPIELRSLELWFCCGHPLAPGPLWNASNVLAFVPRPQRRELAADFRAVSEPYPER